MKTVITIQSWNNYSLQCLPSPVTQGTCWSRQSPMSLHLPSTGTICDIRPSGRDVTKREEIYRPLWLMGCRGLHLLIKIQEHPNIKYVKNRGNGDSLMCNHGQVPFPPSTTTCPSPVAGPSELASAALIESDIDEPLMDSVIDRDHQETAVTSWWCAKIPRDLWCS